MHIIEKQNVLMNNPNYNSSNKEMKRNKRTFKPGNREMIDNGVEPENQMLLYLIIRLF